MDLRESLKELTKQNYNTFELCIVRGDVDKQKNTCTVEPINRPEYSQSGIPFQDNFIYNVKYSPTIDSSIVEVFPGVICLVAFTDKYNGYIILSNQTAKLVLTNQKTGATIDQTVDKDGNLVYERGDNFAGVSKISNKFSTVNGENSLIVEQKNIYQRSTEGSIMNVSKDIEILTGKDGKINIAVQTTNFVNNKIVKKSFLKPNKTGNPVYTTQQVYDSNILVLKELLQWYNKLAENTADEYINTYIPNLETRIKGLTSNGYGSEFTEFYMRMQSIKVISLLRGYVLVQNLKINCLALILSMINTNSSIILPTTSPDYLIYNNFLEFNNIIKNNAKINDPKIVTSIGKFIVDNSLIVGFYYDVVKNIIAKIGVNFYIKDQTDLNAIFKYVNDYKDLYSSNADTQSFGDAILDEEFSNINNLESVTTTISLKTIIDDQTALIKDLTKQVKALKDAVNNLVSSGIVCATPGSPAVITGQAQFVLDAANIGISLSTLENDITTEKNNTAKLLK